ncbi:hypothetical protein DPMN_124748 [Dreissena polymorpha]|uniref:Uncharacterized protein n=1 Tax=Dreissena polymorpha TaxID=45954 RepID=A0A9D4GT63_DREPO|nr:hypothetical protein DPMN_124748 [Dreissena polymorpha]
MVPAFRVHENLYQVAQKSLQVELTPLTLRRLLALVLGDNGSMRSPTHNLCHSLADGSLK